MNIHFIAIGGSAMHNLAIALHKKGYQITGSDDEIFNPSKGRLEKYNLLPKQIGWNTNLIHKNLDAVILGMHARENNPELLKAKELNIPVYSYPEFVYNQTKDKNRVVIGGSHGKTTITSMTLHVLHNLNKEIDYLVGAQLEGFEVMVKLNENTDIAILEGDEYLSSPIDRRPKFHLYKPNIAVISGIAWDHINVFPTFENYVEQFNIFIHLIEEKGTLIYCQEDEILNKLIQKNKTLLESKNIDIIGYRTHPYSIQNGQVDLISDNNRIPILVFGEHNLQNLFASKHICNSLGINDEDFYEQIKTFKGASKRLELVKKNSGTSIYKDFAHSPSKLKATTKAVKNLFPERKLIACIELHTFSSLNESFLSEYKNTLKDADKGYIYFNPKTIEHKKLAQISKNDVMTAFGTDNLEVFTDSKELMSLIKNNSWENKNLLLMSSGNFDGIDFKELANELI